MDQPTCANWLLSLGEGQIRLHRLELDPLSSLAACFLFQSVLCEGCPLTNSGFYNSLYCRYTSTKSCSFVLWLQFPSETVNATKLDSSVDVVVTILASLDAESGRQALVDLRIRFREYKDCIASTMIC